MSHPKILSDYKLLRAGTQLVPTQTALVWVEGEEATEFLQGLVTQDVEQMDLGQVARSFLLSPQGKLQAMLWLLRDQHRVGILTAVDQVNQIVDTLSYYRIRVKVKIQASLEPATELWGGEPHPPEWKPTPQGIRISFPLPRVGRQLLVGAGYRSRAEDTQPVIGERPLEPQDSTGSKPSVSTGLPGGLSSVGKEPTTEKAVVPEEARTDEPRAVEAVASVDLQEVVTVSDVAGFSGQSERENFASGVGVSAEPTWGPNPIPMEVVEIIRVEEGEPRMGVDVSSSTIPQETGLEAQAISFEKGCYLGQELVARIHSRGRVNRLLRAVVMDDPTGPPPAAGASLVFEVTEVGTLSSVVYSPRLGTWLGMAMARTKAETGQTVQITWNDHTTTGRLANFPVG